MEDNLDPGQKWFDGKRDSAIREIFMKNYGPDPYIGLERDLLVRLALKHKSLADLPYETVDRLIGRYIHRGCLIEREDKVYLSDKVLEVIIKQEEILK